MIIPAGTRISFDGAILFETKENLEIKAGQTYGDVEGICTTAGDVGNNLAAGQVKELVDLYDYYQKAENITATSGGAEEEDDASYYERMRESMESFSTAGPINGYIYWTKSVSPAVADVAVTSPEPCVVDVRVLLQNGQQATSGVLKEIEDALNASDIRPLTDKVTVSAPETVAFDIDVTFYIPQPDAASVTVIAAAATQAVEEYVTWQTSKMGRDINPSYLTAKLMEAGVKQTAYNAMKAGEKESNTAEPLEALTATPAATVVINTTAPVTTTEKVAIATDNVPEGATETNADGTVNLYDAAGNITGSVTKEEAEKMAAEVTKIVDEEGNAGRP